MKRSFAQARLMAALFRPTHQRRLYPVAEAVEAEPVIADARQVGLRLVRRCKCCGWPLPEAPPSDSV